MAHIQTNHLKLWKPQNITLDKISSQKMFVDNIEALESFGLFVLKNTTAPVSTLEELRAIDTSDTMMFSDGKTIMVKSNGIFFFDRGNVNADNGKTIIAPTVGGGRWVSEHTFLSDFTIPINDQTPTYAQHSTLTNIVSGEKLSVSFGKIMKAIADLISHIANKSNPHEVNKAQVGLGNVDNTSDSNKPVSTAQATAIADAKKAGTDAQNNLTTHINNKSNPHEVTKAQVGLGNVPNVTTNDQTPTFTQAGTLANLTSGEKLSVSFGKIMKAIADLISHIANKSNPHGVTASQIGVTASGIGAIPTAFSINDVSTNEDDLDAILTNTIDGMIDNSTKIIRVNFSMQHEFFVSGITAAIIVFKGYGANGCAVASTFSKGYPEVLIKGLSDGTWGTWRVATGATFANTLADAEVI